MTDKLHVCWSNPPLWTVPVHPFFVTFETIHVSFYSVRLKWHLCWLPDVTFICFDCSKPWCWLNIICILYLYAYIYIYTYINSIKTSLFLLAEICMCSKTKHGFKVQVQNSRSPIRSFLDLQDYFLLKNCMCLFNWGSKSSTLWDLLYFMKSNYSVRSFSQKNYVWVWFSLWPRKFFQHSTPNVTCGELFQNGTHQPTVNWCFWFELLILLVPWWYFIQTTS